MTSIKDSKQPVAFRAIDPYIERHDVRPTETVLRGKDLVQWGECNRFPAFLLDLYNNAPTLRAVINGTTDFITGDDVTLADFNPAYKAGTVNPQGDTIASQVRALAQDFMTFGGFALQVVRDWAGRVAALHYLDIRHLRSNKENTVFYYREDWDKSRGEAVIYPAFLPDLDWSKLDDAERERQVSSVLFVKNTHTQVYPSPVYVAAIKAAQVEMAIADFHLNSIENSFTASQIINFNNGQPTEEQMEEIEESVNEKFSGHQNASRIFLSWNRSKDAETTITSPKVEDFGARYDALEKSVRQQIFTAFRANPNLFGIPTESLGFSSEEYESAFRLFNRTTVRPAQRIICDAYDRALGVTGALTIKPFSLDDTGAEQNVN